MSREKGGVRPRIAVLAPQFPPCNLAVVHRARFVAKYLPECGFEPVVFTVRREDYETILDHGLEELLPGALEIVRTAALPTRPVRLVGDLALRAFLPMLGAIERAHAVRPFAAAIIPMPPFYSAILGTYLRLRHGIPYLLDFTDPWVQPVLPAEWRRPKALLSHLLARLLEPVAVRFAAGLATVAPLYLSDLYARRPRARDLPVAAAPMGFDGADQALTAARGVASVAAGRPGLADKQLLVYAGALLPRARDTYRAHFRALARLRAEDPEAARALHFLFIGTDRREMAPLAAEEGVADAVTEIPERQPYLSVLATLGAAHAVLVPGSSEPHYTASKLFQALLSRRPVLAAFHAESTALALLSGVPGVELVEFDDAHPALARVPELAAALGRLARMPAAIPVRSEADLPAALSAQAAVRSIAAVLSTITGGR